MSTEVVKELIHNLKNTFSDRLTVIEDILSTARQSANPVDSAKITELEARLHSLDDYAMGQVRTLAFNHDQLELFVKNLEERLMSLEHSMKTAVVSFQVINDTMGLLQKRMNDEKPVEAAEAEAEIEEAQEAALNAETDAVLVEKKAKVSLAKAVEQLVDEEEEEEEDDNTTDEEAEAEEEEVEEEEEEAEEEEAEEESPYDHIFTHEEVDYYVDRTTNNVYNPDEDGGVDPEDIKGIWNASTEKMWIPSKKKWWDYKTNKYTEPKAKK
jgi:hypothetical protein